MGQGQETGGNRVRKQVGIGSGNRGELGQETGGSRVRKRAVASFETDGGQLAGSGSSYGS